MNEALLPKIISHCKNLDFILACISAITLIFPLLSNVTSAKMYSWLSLSRLSVFSADVNCLFVVSLFYSCRISVKACRVQHVRGSCFELFGVVKLG